MKSQSLIAIICCFCLIAGCGKSAPPIPKTGSPEIKNGSIDVVKSRLQGIEQSGSVGSALAGMKEAIEKLPADKSGPLLTDLNELQQAMKADKVKEIAKRMLSKL